MTATERLRELLDERGVEWWPLGKDMTETVIADVRHKFRQVGRGIIWSSCTESTVPPAQAVAATLGRGECREVYLLKATDIGDGREYVLGVYATEGAATAAIEENRFGYAFHHVQKWVVE